MGIIIITVSPIVMIVIESFVTSHEPLVYSLENYITVFTQKDFHRYWVNTLLFAGGSTVVSVVFGLLLALLVTRTDMPFKRELKVLNLIPSFTPPLLMAMAWAFVASPRIGIINTFLRKLLGFSLFNIYSLWGLVWVEGLLCMPIVYLFVMGSLQVMDPELEEASKMCGSNTIDTLRRVTFPLTAPAIFAGGSLVFIRCLGSFFPIIFGWAGGIDVFATAIYDYTRGALVNWGMGSTLALTLILLTSTLTLARRTLLRRKQYVLRAGRSLRPNVIHLGKLKYIALAINSTYLTLSTLLPLMVLLLVSLSKYWEGSFDPSLFTLGNYSYLYTSPMVSRAFTNTILLAVTGATLISLVAVPLAYLSERGRFKGKGTIMSIILAPLGMPGIVLGIGYLWVMVYIPFIYNTLWALLIAYAGTFTAFAVTQIIPTLVKLPESLEESCRVCGASRLRTLKDVVFPLLKPAFISTWLLMFIYITKEMTSVILLCYYGTEVLSVAYFLAWLQGDMPVAAAVGMVDNIIMLVSLVVFMRLTPQESS